MNANGTLLACAACCCEAHVQLPSRPLPGEPAPRLTCALGELVGRIVSNF